MTKLFLIYLIFINVLWVSDPQKLAISLPMRGVGIYFIIIFGVWSLGFQGGSVVRNLPANAGDMDLIPGLGRSPEEMATYSSVLAWIIPWAEKAGYSPRGRKELDTIEQLSMHTPCPWFLNSSQSPKGEMGTLLFITTPVP